MAHAPQEPTPVAQMARPPGTARRRSAGGLAALTALCVLLGATAGALGTYGALHGRTTAAPPAVVASPVALTGEVDVAAIYRQAAPAVVQVVRPGRSPTPAGAGSGFVFDGRGYILTAYHVVEDSARVQVRFDDGTELAGRVVGSDASNDLAVVRVDPGGRTLPVLPLGDSDAVRPGEPAIAIGYPLGGKAVTAGIVSAKDRSAESPAGWQQVGLIQTDAALYPGNSGGPLLNARGEVIGIAAQVAGPGPGGIGLAVPINTAKRLLPDLMAGRAIQHAWLGISGAPLDTLQAEELRLPERRGVVVYEVVPGSPAAAAGLRPATRTDRGHVVPGDVIRAIDGHPVASVEDLAAYLATRRPGERVTLTLLRDGRRVDVAVTLAARPARAP